MTPTPESQQAAEKQLEADILEALSPTGSLTNAPAGSKIDLLMYRRVMKVIDQHFRTPAPVDVSHAALAGKLEEFAAISATGKPIYLDISSDLRDAAIALRAHPAGGVSEDVVERCAKLLDPWIWRELADHEDTPDNRATMQVTKEISRDRMRKALRAAGIGAGVVENDK